MTRNIKIVTKCLKNLHEDIVMVASHGLIKVVVTLTIK